MAASAAVAASASVRPGDAGTLAVRTKRSSANPAQTTVAARTAKQSVP